jgi:hypothetical protein
MLSAQPLQCAYPSYIKETIPPSELGYATNNQYPKFPPLMGDGRSVISSWNAESIVDKVFQQEYGRDLLEQAPLSPNWSYRRYMQQHGYELMGKNFIDTANDTGSQIPPSSRTNGDKNAPYLFSALGENSRPIGYESSDLKDLYLSREQLNARMYAPKIT